jgi:hypothetical protein
MGANGCEFFAGRKMAARRWGQSKAAEPAKYTKYAKDFDHGSRRARIGNKQKDEAKRFFTGGNGENGEKIGKKMGAKR